MVQVLQKLAVAPRLLLVGVASVALVAVAVADVGTGDEVSLRLLYVIPVLVVTWSLGVRAGIGVAVAATVVSMAAAFGRRDGVDAIPFVNGAVRLAVLVFVALLVGELRRAVDEERRGARVDPSTGALTRWAFLEQAELVCAAPEAAARPLALMHVDTDRFKVLETNADGAGDRVGRLVVASLGAAIGDAAVIGRLGGDEFVALLPDADVGSALEVAGRVRDAAMAGAGRALRLGPDVGIAVFRRAPSDPDELLRAADDLVYEGRRRDESRTTAVIVGQDRADETSARREVDPPSMNGATPT